MKGRSVKTKRLQTDKPRRGDDPEKVRRLHTLRCLCWASDPGGCGGRLEVHHVRTLGSRATDRRTVPLCSQHHRLGPHSIHALGRRGFQEFHKSRNGVPLDLDVEVAYYQQWFGSST